MYEIYSRNFHHSKPIKTLNKHVNFSLEGFEKRYCNDHICLTNLANAHIQVLLLYYHQHDEMKCSLFIISSSNQDYSFAHLLQVSNNMHNFIHISIVNDIRSFNSVQSSRSYVLAKCLGILTFRNSYLRKVSNPYRLALFSIDIKVFGNDQILRTSLRIY